MFSANSLLFESLFDTLPTGMILVEPGGTIVGMNLKAKEILGVRADFVPLVLRDLTVNETSFLQPLATLLGSDIADVQRAELPMQLPVREEESTIGYSLKRVTSPEGQVVKAFTFSDITQILKDRSAMDKIKDELGQSKRLAAMGTMIAGVAHEMNNPLTGISMSASLLKLNLERLQKLPAVQDEAKLEDGLNKALQEVQKVARECERAAVLVADLLSYGKPVQFCFVPTTLHEMVLDTVNALRTHPKFSQFTMTVSAAPEILAVRVRCDRVKLEQVFYNLIKNACDATEGKGVLSIEFSDSVDKVGKSFITTHVRDNGPGISEADMAHIFDPFFTTKGHGGVGLGLSICYRTIELHGGFLSVESVKGEGTEFKVTLPLYLEEESEHTGSTPGADS